MLLSARDTLRVGGEYQRYQLNDWWEPSGNGGMSPNTFWNIRDGERNPWGSSPMGSPLEPAMVEPVRAAP